MALSEGAVIAIAVCVPLGVILLAVLAFYIWYTFVRVRTVPFKISFVDDNGVVREEIADEGGAPGEAGVGGAPGNAPTGAPAFSSNNVEANNNNMGDYDIHDMQQQQQQQQPPPQQQPQTMMYGGQQWGQQQQPQQQLRPLPPGIG